MATVYAEIGKTEYSGKHLPGMNATEWQHYCHADVTYLLYED